MASLWGHCVAELRAKRGYLLLSDGLQEAVGYLSAAERTDRPELVTEVTAYLGGVLSEIATDTSDIDGRGRHRHRSTTTWST